MPRPVDAPLLSLALAASAVAPDAPIATGLNFAAWDCLALAGHPAMARAVGDLAVVPDLAARVAGFLQMPHAAVFASGTEAIRAALRHLLRPEDHVIVDHGAHSALFETVVACRATLHRAPPGSVEAVERRLHRLTSTARRGRIIVAVPAVSATTSVVADLPTLADLCQTYGAVLLVDVSHDIGAMGQDGRGVMEVQGCTDRADIVLGSFAATFGAAGGFVAVRDDDLWSAMTPDPQAVTQDIGGAARVILAAFEIIDSAQGRTRRRRLHANSLRLRNHLMADGLRVIGQPSALVPVLLPMLTALARTALLESAGAKVRLLRAPDVALHAPRWRVQICADHSAADIDDLADLIRDVARVFDRQSSRADRRERVSHG